MVGRVGECTAWRVREQFRVKARRRQVEETINGCLHASAYAYAHAYAYAYLYVYVYAYVYVYVYVYAYASPSCPWPCERMCVDLRNQNNESSSMDTQSKVNVSSEPAACHVNECLHECSMHHMLLGVKHWMSSKPV